MAHTYGVATMRGVGVGWHQEYVASVLRKGDARKLVLQFDLPCTVKAAGHLCVHPSISFRDSFAVVIRAKCLREITCNETGTFEGCTNLTEITIPGTVRVIGRRTFFGCEELSAVNVPACLTTLGNFAFCLCVNLNEVDLSGCKLTSIKEASFSHCRTLKRVSLPSTLKTIEFWAFANCFELADLQLPGFVETIETQAFYNCASLREVWFPGTVKKLGNESFRGCNKLERVACACTDVAKPRMFGPALKELVCGPTHVTEPVKASSSAWAIAAAKAYYWSKRNHDKLCTPGGKRVVSTFMFACRQLPIELRFYILSYVLCHKLA